MHFSDSAITYLDVLIEDDALIEVRHDEVEMVGEPTDGEDDHDHDHHLDDLQKGLGKVTMSGSAAAAFST